MKRILLLLFLVFLITSCTNLDLQGYVPGVHTATPAPSSVRETVPSSPTPVTGDADWDTNTRVCTNTPGGRLHVRISPGVSGPVHGYLSEGEVVVLTGENKRLEGSLWVKLSQPVDGWVNESYLCLERH